MRCVPCGMGALTPVDLEALYARLSDEWAAVEAWLNARLSPNQIAPFNGLIDSVRTRLAAAADALGRRDYPQAESLLRGFSPAATKDAIARGANIDTGVSIGLVLGTLALGGAIWMFGKTVGLGASRKRRRR